MRSRLLLTRWGQAEVQDLVFALCCPATALAAWHRLGSLPVDHALAGIIPTRALTLRPLNAHRVVRSVGRATDLVLRKGLPTPARCTVMAATRVALLRAAGVRAQYVSGAGLHYDGLRFHAWVELGEHRLYELDDTPYQPLFRFPVLP